MAYEHINTNNSNEVIAAGYEVFTLYLETYRNLVLYSNVHNAQGEAIDEFYNLVGNEAYIELLQSMSNITKDYLTLSDIQDTLNSLKPILLAWFEAMAQFDTVLFKTGESIQYLEGNIIVHYDSELNVIYNDQKLNNYNDYNKKVFQNVLPPLPPPPPPSSTITIDDVIGLRDELDALWECACPDRVITSGKQRILGVKKEKHFVQNFYVEQGGELIIQGNLSTEYNYGVFKVDRMLRNEGAIYNNGLIIN